jgi:type II secretory pathway pseudopilin PulG
MLKILNNSRGDTIVEVMIAISIIGAVIVGATISVNNTNSTLFASQVRQQALQVLQNQMEIIKAANNEVISGGKLTDLCSSTSCDSSGSHYFCVDANSSFHFHNDPSSLPAMAPSPLTTHFCYFDYTGSTYGVSGYFEIQLWMQHLYVPNSFPPKYSNNYQINGKILWTDSTGTKNNANLSYELSSN